jgi:hypothetical protein
VLSIDAGMKYRGLFLATEFHQRWLDDFVASGPIPVTSVFDHGFYAQGSHIFKPVNVEVSASTSYFYTRLKRGFRL